jgi:hypothetical protein
MDSTTNLFLIGALCVGLPLLVGVAAWAAIKKIQARRLQKDIDTVSAAIVDYFRKSEIEVKADCVPIAGTRRLTVFIESEPMKQFRLSHIIESSLRDMVHNLHRVELDKVYWRFPIRKRLAGDGAPAPEDQQKKPGLDDYITEGLNYRHLPKAEVGEASIEDFEQASTSGPKHVD